MNVREVQRNLEEARQAFWGQNPLPWQGARAVARTRATYDHIRIEDNGQVFKGDDLVGTLIPFGRYTQDLFDPLRNAVEQFYARERGESWKRAAHRAVNDGADPPHDIQVEASDSSLDSDDTSLDGLVGPPQPAAEDDSEEEMSREIVLTNNPRPPTPPRNQNHRLLSPVSFASLRAHQEADEDMRFDSMQRMSSENYRVARCQYLNQLLRRKIELDFEFTKMEYEHRSSLQFQRPDAAYSENVRRRIETACSNYYNEHSLDLNFYRRNVIHPVALPPEVNFHENIFDSGVKSFDWWFDLATMN